MGKVITRRGFLGHTAGAFAATAIIGGTATAPGTVAKLIGIRHSPYQSQKFSGRGYYAFGRADGSGMRVYYAEPDRGGHLPGFIDLSQGPGEPLQVSISARGFDDCCWGICMTQAEAEGRVS